jgi:hypothetical protein
MALADDRVDELPLPDVFGDGEVNRLLVKLREVHGEGGRPDVAHELVVRAPSARHGSPALLGNRTAPSGVWAGRKGRMPLARRHGGCGQDQP